MFSKIRDFLYCIFLMRIRHRLNLSLPLNSKKGYMKQRRVYIPWNSFTVYHPHWLAIRTQNIISLTSLHSSNCKKTRVHDFIWNPFVSILSYFLFCPSTPFWLTDSDFFFFLKMIYLMEWPSGYKGFQNDNILVVGSKLKKMHIWIALDNLKGLWGFHSKISQVFVLIAFH